MLVRRARPEELTAVGDLTVAAYEEFTLGPGDPYRERLRDAATRDREAELWVASDGDVLLGTVTYCPPGSPWREIAGEDEGEFRMLAVAPAARGRGAGSRLVRHCEERARGHGAAAMALSSLESMTAAHSVYRAQGYVRDPERDWEPVPGVRLIAFAKALGDPVPDTHQEP